MSSIYRKGRDGYFYYQAYIFNPSTGRRDKRIFHSLGTKDESIAKHKQQELDSKYKKNNTSQGPNGKNEISAKKIGLFIILLSGLFSIIISFIFNNNDKKISLEKIPINPPRIIKNKETSKPAGINVIETRELDGKHSQKKSIVENQNDIVKKEEIEKPKIPSYIIQKIDQLSDGFEQGKLFITVDDNYNSEGLQKLCEQIAKEYSQFSNIIICLYSNNKIGKELAQGLGGKILNLDQKRAWIGFYTYNAVEGAYFDDNPTGYLGI